MDRHQKSFLVPGCEHTTHLDYFSLKKHYPKLVRTRHIYYHPPFIRKWQAVLFLLAGILMACISWSHGSPPPSRGARPVAFGNGYTAVSGDSYCLFYNPAGLADINQREVTFDYGNSHSQNESARSDFNGIFATPFRFKDNYIPLAVGFYGEQNAPGAHVIDLSVGGGSDAPVDRWTKGFFKFPVRLGGAVTIRQQQGPARSERVGTQKVGAGVTAGLIIPIDRADQVGLSIRDLFPSNVDPYGPTLNVGIFRQQKDIFNFIADMEYAKGGLFRFHPGFEFLFARGVLRPRIGYSPREKNGISNIAMGLGVYLSPVQVDVTYVVPTRTVTDNVGQFRASVTYRFGRPQFSEIYYDKALEQASQLDSRVLGLTVKEAELKASVAELEQKVRLAKEDLDNAKARVESLKDSDLLGQRDATIRQLRARVHDLEAQLGSERHQVKQLREEKATIRTHTVVAGDTLQSIAKQYYGDPNQWKKVYNANADKIDRGLPRPGEKLVIP